MAEAPIEFWYTTKYVQEFLHLMHEGLTVCYREKASFLEVRKGHEDPGRFIEEIIPKVERLTGERGQMAVWIAYALWDMVVDPNRD